MKDRDKTVRYSFLPWYPYKNENFGQNNTMGCSVAFKDLKDVYSNPTRHSALNRDETTLPTTCGIIINMQVKQYFFLVWFLANGLQLISQHAFFEHLWIAHKFIFPASGEGPHEKNAFDKNLRRNYSSSEVLRLYLIGL